MAGTIPAAPTGLTGTGGAGTATVTWQSSAGATSYNVYRSPDQTTWTKIGGTPACSYIDGNAPAGTQYYTASAVNGAGESPHAVDCPIMIGAKSAGA